MTFVSSQEVFCDTLWLSIFVDLLCPGVSWIEILKMCAPQTVMFSKDRRTVLDMVTEKLGRRTTRSFSVVGSPANERAHCTDEQTRDWNFS